MGWGYVGGGGGLLDVGYVEGVRWGGGGGVGEYVGGGAWVSWGGGGVWDLNPGRPLKNRSKTAQILLEKPFKNHRKK